MPKRLIALDIAGTSFVENYRISAARGVIRYARQHTEWQLLYNEPNFSLRNSFSNLEDLHSLHADGIIFYFWERQKLERIRALGLPMVSISSDDQPGPPTFASVVTDDPQVGRLAARHFIERGFRHFGFYGNPGLVWERDRFAGYESELQSAGHQVLRLENASFDQGERTAGALEAWLHSLPRPIAVFGATDSRALHVLEACNQRKIAVPGEVAIVGVDNNPLICESRLPSLSSVVLNPERVGYEAAALLDRMLGLGRPLCETIIIPPMGIETRMSSDIAAVDDEPLALALHFIRDHATEPLQIRDVVKASGLSRSTLERRFRERVKCTLNEALCQRRLERARALLLDTSLSLNEVAEASGFRRATYLCNVFHREMGTTPTAWRAANRIHSSPAGHAPAPSSRTHTRLNME